MTKEIRNHRRCRQQLLNIQTVAVRPHHLRSLTRASCPDVAIKFTRLRSRRDRSHLRCFIRASLCARRAATPRCAVFESGFAQRKYRLRRLTRATRAARACLAKSTSAASAADRLSARISNLRSRD